MLGGLFKPAWQSPSAEKRLLSIAKLDAGDGESLAILEELASKDLELEVRKAAIAKLPPLSVYSIVSSHPDQETKSCAETVFAALVGPKSTLTEEELRALVNQLPDAKSLIAKVCPSANLRSELLSSLTEPELAELISEMEYAETRSIIAEKLESLEYLELARKALKGKDKSAEKIVKSKIDKIRAAEKLAKENRETAEDLCQKMEYLASQEWRAEFKRRYLAVNTQWESLDFTPEEDIQARYQQAKEKVSVEAERQEQIDLAHQTQETLAKRLEEYCIELAGESLDQLQGTHHEIQSKYDEAKTDWEKASETVRAHLNTADRFFLAEGALKSLLAFIDSATNGDSESDKESTTDSQPKTQSAETLKQSLSLLKWPKTYPALLAEAATKAKLSELKDALRSEQKALKEKLDKLHKRIGRIQGAARRGEIGRARRELEAVSKAAEQYDGKDRASLDDRIAKASESVTKMGDWKDFATEPKYAELCELMEALKDSKAHPDKLAKEIKDLQDKWKALGHSDASDKYWERFKAAGDTAYEPCATFFQERKDTRKQNLESREPLVAQTQALLDETDWEGQPDYKAIENEVRRIGEDWKKIKDVDPRAGQKQWKRFCALKDGIYDKLGVVYDANIAEKQQLIDQAVALGETEVNEQSLTRLQQIQARWKQVGVTRRKDDQAAWKKFKAATDGVYEKIQGVRQVKRDEENQQLDGYRNVIKQIQSLAKSATDLAEADHSFERLQTEYSELPELPKGLPEKLIEGLGKDYQRACDFYAKSRDRILEAAGKEELNALREKARLCGELEKLALVDGKDSDIENLRSDIDDIEIHDRTLQKRFAPRLAAALEADKTEATERRRLLCIDLEILLGKESPEADREQRMQIQFERMKSQGIGNQNQDKASVIEALKLDWLCLPGADPAVQTALEERFTKLIS